MAIVSSVFKTSTAIVSSTFKISSAVVSSTFKVGGTVSSTFKISSNVLSSVFKIGSTILNDNITYQISSDCSSIIVSIDRDGFLITDIENIDISKVGSNEEFIPTKELVSGIIQITVPITSDGVYEIVIGDTGGAMIARVPMLVICRLAKCFIKYNSLEVLKSRLSSCEPNEWLLLYAIYRGIIANFRVRKYEEASSMILYGSTMCKDKFDNCCSTC